ncbi:MAG: hypothetical protein O2865_04860 [Planctomycetota bacterium]|nr:hypothetical protein [Planctomycetota bacterium]MDA0934448.1 hypothetical protein [Planctomycetota bacterium]
MPSAQGSTGGARRKVGALIEAWLILDFFGDARRSGEPSSSLTSTIFTQSFLALVFAALTFDDQISATAYVAANLSLSTLLLGVGLGTDPGERERRLADAFLVATSPNRRTLLPIARAAHASIQTTLVGVGMALPPAILTGFVQGSPLATLAYLALAVLLAGCAAGAFDLLVRAVDRAGGPIRAALVAGTTKAAVLGVGLLAFATSLPHLDESLAEIPYGTAIGIAWPPYWAARVLTTLAPGPGLALLGLALALVGLHLVLGEAPEDRPSRPRSRPRRGLLDRLQDALCGDDAPLRGTAAWTAAMLFRSPGFRARVLPLFGIPFAMALLALRADQGRNGVALLGVTLQLPAIYLPFLVAFLPHADHAGAAWLFETAPRHGRRLAREAALLALSVRLLLPFHAAAILLLVAAGFPFGPAVALPTFGFATGVGVAALSLRHLEHTPFTQRHDDPPALEFGGLLAIGLVLAALGIGASVVTATPLGALSCVAPALLAATHLRSAPRRLRTAEAST